MSLINLDECLSFLNLDVRDRDKVEILADWVQARAESIIRRKLDKDDYEWLVSGFGFSTIQLPVLPINSVTAVYIDSDRVFSEAIDTSEYHVDTETGIITFYNLNVKGFNVIKVEANAGYDEDNFPADLKMAFYEAIRWNVSRVKDASFGVSTQSTPDGLNMTYEKVLPMGVQRVFESYRDMVY